MKSESDESAASSSVGVVTDTNGSSAIKDVKTESSNENDQTNTTTNNKAIVDDDDDVDKEMIGGCCVCADDNGTSDNLLVYCDGAGCRVAVHEACYGIRNLPEGAWFCRSCEHKNKLAADVKISAGELAAACRHIVS